jgi:lysophospholipase L1-like esterase
MQKFFVIAGVLAFCALQAAPPKSVAPKHPTKKRYRSSGATPRRSTTPKVSAATRAEAAEGVQQKLNAGAYLPMENSAALVPFFEQLYKHQQGELPGPLHLLQYGDSHTAADEWTGDLRERLQERFGDGGSGYTYAGRPYRGYRHVNVKTGSSRGWRTDGLVGRSGDGAYGLGGISMSASNARESTYMLAEGQTFELFYLRQPGGGSFALYDNGELIEQVSTSGELAPAYYRYETDPGLHKLEVETLDRAPVRLFGWTADKASGVTFEPLGINGASAPMILNWNETVLDSNLSRRNPGLIVLAYGTNEAGRKSWTVESYREVFERILLRLRNAVPTATILVIGPPDQAVRTRKGWVTPEQLDTIIEAQHQAAIANGCAFWDLRAKMGGKGSMRQWVLAGLALYDYVHFTESGYKKISSAIFNDLMDQYELFLKARQPVASATPEDKVASPVPR